MLGEHDLRGRERGEDNVFHFQWQFLHATDRVLNPGAHAVDDVKIGFQFLPEHANGIEHAVLPIDVIMLNDGMQKGVLRRNADLARIDLHILDVLLVDLVAIFRQHDAAAIVEALNVRAGDADVDTLRIMTSLFVSASTTASCTHFIAVSKSTISPLRTPRDGAWPTPRILIVPSGLPSPTTTQIFDVPISRPDHQIAACHFVIPSC